MKDIIIVGAGGIGKKHMDGFVRTGKFSISICDTDVSKIEDARDRFPIKRTFGDLDEVNLNNFDAALIATPANFHVPMALRCAEAGIPFLVEKPLSIGLDGVDELIEMVAKKALPCGVGFTRRSVPSFQQFRECLSDGMIGNTKMAMFYSAQDYRKYRPDYADIYFARKDMGGGCILDAVSHLVDLAQWYIGEPGEVVSLYDKLVFGERVEPEDSAILGARFSGKLVNFYCNLFQKPNEFFVEIAGTKGNLRYALETSSHSEVLFLNQDTGNWQEIETFDDELSDAYMQQAYNFWNLLQGKSHTLTSLQEAKENLEFCLRAKGNK